MPRGWYETTNEHRFRIGPEYDTMRIIQFKGIEGVQLLVGKDPDSGSMKAMSVRFKKDNWTQAKAQKWLENHPRLMNAGDYEESVMERLKAVLDRIEEAASGNAKKVAGTIMKQIGNKAFTMIGAKGFLYGSDSKGIFLQFKIGRNSKKINMINVYYDEGTDLYNMEFGRLRGYDFKVVKSVSGVEASQLKPMIRRHTGMDTNL